MDFVEYLPAIAITIGIIIVVIAAMLWGWRAQQRRHAGFPMPPPVPAEQQLGEPVVQAEGQYVSTTFTTDRLTRINAYTLGNKANALLQVFTDGVCFRREAEDDVYIPVSAITEVRYDSGQAGKFVEKDGLIVLDWILGDTGQHPEAAGDPGDPAAVSTGFRLRYADEKKPLREALDELMASTIKEKNA